MTSSSHNLKKTRYFNTLEDHGDFYKKVSTDKDKLFQEFQFIDACPTELKAFFPIVKSFSTDEHTASYFVKKVDGVEASQYLVQGDDSKVLLILKLIDKFLGLLPSITCNAKDYSLSFHQNITQKNLHRLSLIKNTQYISEFNLIAQRYGHVDLEVFIGSLNTLTQSALDDNDLRLYHIHGDLCFSNILLSEDTLYLVDPKGAPTAAELYRPIVYDLAKLSQSLLGGYDQIVEKSFSLVDHTVQFNKDCFLPASFDFFHSMVDKYGLSLRTVRLVEATLLFSMLPFHIDDFEKMKAFLIQSLKLHRDLS